MKSVDFLLRWDFAGGGDIPGCCAVDTCRRREKQMHWIQVKCGNVLQAGFTVLCAEHFREYVNRMSYPSQETT